MIRNRVSVCLRVDSGCKLSEEEYSIEVLQLIGSLDIDRDIELIRECVEENLPNSNDGVSDDDSEYVCHYELVMTNEPQEIYYEVVSKEVIGYR